MSFTVKKEGNLIFNDLGGYETRNMSTMWCIEQADKIYNWNDFAEIKIHTGDYEASENDYTYSKQNSYQNVVPDFNFESWPQVGIDDYDEFIKKIDVQGLLGFDINKVGWIGNPDTHPYRHRMIEIGEGNKDLFDFFGMNWNKPGKYISTPDLVKKYSMVIDIEGSGYSGRLKHLLHSHRPLLLVDRPHKEYFFEHLKEWEHYIPVNRDLSDLVEKTKWCLENYEKALTIAENAYQFSKKYLSRAACFNQWNTIINKHIIKNSDVDVIVVGCGLSGCVTAERFACKGKKVLILEKREHIGGNCYDYVDEQGILMNKYGAHLFHTNNERVWNYVNKFDKWVRWDHKVIGNVGRQLVPIPVNITTVNTLCDQTIKNEQEMDKWLKETQVVYDEITNSEEVAKSRVGEVLYDKIFKDYTYKQWNKYPEELKPEVLARIPIRNNFDDRYFSDRFQALPHKGYTHFFNKLLDNPLIRVCKGVDFLNLGEIDLDNKIVIYTGPIDEYFSGHDKLEYRSIDFVIERYKNMNYYQPNSVVNYPGKEVDFTRIVEYKHFLNQESPHTTIVKEYTKSDGEPYYPVPTQKNMERYEKYKELAKKEKGVHFLGRLATYKYFNMDEAILNALEYFDKHFE